jgi:hypothetical protein
MAAEAHAGIGAPSEDSGGPYVLNLCSSTTPMALSQPDAPELKRFSFFVSRRREEGRERFRLHMGYFATLAEAEEWLAVVRDIYPGAWAGEAPGKKLREREAQAKAAAAAAAAPTPVATVVRPVQAPRPAAAAQPVRAPSAPVHAAPSVARAPETPAPVTRTAAPPAKAPAPNNIPTVHAAQAPRQAAKAALSAARASLQQQSAAAAPARPVAAAPAKPQAPRAPAPARATPAAQSQPRSPGSNVREVLKALDEHAETGQTRIMRAPAPPRAVAQTESKSLSDTQVLKILEQRSERRNDEASAVALLKPDDTGTRRALKQAVQNNAPVAFAVQLLWSVQPVELDKVPPLAIFSAYTLYTVEGSREGRKWYGLRLGFFSDVISAKQVAYYVRSEFNSVAVVPVSEQERTRATEAQNKAALPANPRPKPTSQRKDDDEFKLLDDDTPPPIERSQTTPALKPKAPAPSPKRPPKSGGNRVRARARKSPQTLEETLEILGASARGSLLNDTGVRHLRVEVKKDTAFSRLLDRLSERVRRE